MFIESESELPETEFIKDMTDNPSLFTLKKVINHLQSTTTSDKIAMTTIVKSICRIYFKATAVR